MGDDVKLGLLILALATGQAETPYQEALRTGRPLIIGNACAPPAGEWLVEYRKELPGYVRGSIVVCVPNLDRTAMRWVATLSPYAQPEHVRKALADRVIESVVPEPRLPRLFPRKYNPETTPNFQERFNRRPMINRRAFSSGGNC
jgi:hypothetical protein